MGLVIQAVAADSLFAPLAVQTPAVVESGKSPQTDVFAQLLAGLAGDAPSERSAADALTTVANPGDAVAEPADADAATETPAVMAAMQLLAQLNPLMPGPVNGGQSDAETKVAIAPQIASGPETAVEDGLSSIAEAPPIGAGTSAGMGAEAAVQAADLPGSPDASVPPTEASSPPAGPPTEATAEQPLANNAMAAIEAATSDVTGHGGVKERAKPDTPKPKDEAPLATPEALANSTGTNSVVRTAGNAQGKGQQDGHANPNAGDGKANAKPNASAEGIAHAAANSAVGQLRVTDATIPEPPQTTPTPAALPEAVDHVGRTIIQKVEQGGGEARLTLRPEALGEVVLHIHTDGDRVRVEIHAERAEAANLLRDHTQDLSQLLGQRGLNLTDVYVGLGGQGSNNQQDGLPAWARPRQQADNSFASLLGIEDQGAADRSNRLRSAYNPDGAMSYRV